MKIENENTFLAAMNTGLNLFVGAGFSTLATDHKGQSLPIGSELQQELAEFFNLPSELDLTQMATILNASRKDEFRAYLKSRFTVAEFDSRYQVIETLPLKSIFTTNVDNLLYEIFKGSNTSYLNDLDVRGSTFHDQNSIDLVTLHGCILDDTREFTFDATSLASASTREPDRWYFLSHALESVPTLFCGYSLADSGTLSMLHPSTVDSRELSDKWITVLPGTDEGTRRYFRALNFQVIDCDMEELLDYFRKHSRVDETHPPVTSSRELVPGLNIPEFAEVAVRSIFDYFRGAPPTWSDIYSGQLTTTSHHARVRNALNSQQHTFVTGIPGSGKTTLMMQVAKDFPFAGHKLLCEAPTPEKAKFILNKLAGSHALICIDNFADDLDGVNVLLNAPNVQILGSEEIYWLETVTHRLPREKIHIIDITDLTDEDTQSIVDRIPSDVRIANSSLRPLGSGYTPSIFEIVESNTHHSTLSERYKKVLQTLESHNVLLLEFLLVCSYVHRCRTPISSDMLLAFFRGTGINYEHLYEMRNKIQGIVVDYVGDLDDGAQDYFSPRSSLISEAVIGQATSGQLKRMVTRFHEQVSSFRIHRHDVFRRRAFDHELMRLVFRDWEEGKEFYRQSYSREDQNPFVLQQGALYLSRKHRFQEAFQMIDEALSRTSRRIPSIRNSHATILFRANINRGDTDDGIVKRTLQESMDILRECYAYDQRKAYHAQIFADQSLRYESRYGREEGQAYLETALTWLKEEVRRSPWNREVKRLRGVVARRLSSSLSLETLV